MAKTKDFARVIHRQLAGDARLRSAVEKERLNASIAALIYNARTEAGLTQSKLAELVGTHQSVIARLEDADYAGHSLSMLEKISAALGRQLTVAFEPIRKGKAPKQPPKSSIQNPNRRHAVQSIIPNRKPRT